MSMPARHRAVRLQPSRTAAAGWRRLALRAPPPSNLGSGPPSPPPPPQGAGGQPPARRAPRPAPPARAATQPPAAGGAADARVRRSGSGMWKHMREDDQGRGASACQAAPLQTATAPPAPGAQPAGRAPPRRATHLPLGAQLLRGRRGAARLRAGLLAVVAQAARRLVAARQLVRLAKGGAWRRGSSGVMAVAGGRDAADEPAPRGGPACWPPWPSGVVRGARCRGAAARPRPCRARGARTCLATASRSWPTVSTSCSSCASCAAAASDAAALAADRRACRSDTCAPLESTTWGCVHPRARRQAVQWSCGAVGNEAGRPKGPACGRTHAHAGRRHACKKGGGAGESSRQAKGLAGQVLMA